MCVYFKLRFGLLNLLNAYSRLKKMCDVVETFSLVLPFK